MIRYLAELALTAGVVLIAAVFTAAMTGLVRRVLQPEPAARATAMGRHPAQHRPRLLPRVPAQRTDPDRRCPTCGATFEGCTCTCGSRTPREDTST